MARAVDRALKLFRCQKLRNRTLELKLGQRARLVLIDLSLRVRRVANDVSKKIECLVHVFNQTTGADHARHRREARVCREGRAESINLLGDVLARTLAGAFTQQGRAETRQPAIFRFVRQTATQHHELHVKGGDFMGLEQDYLKSILESGFLGARKFHFQNFFTDRRFAFDNGALGGLLLARRGTLLAKSQRRHQRDQQHCDNNIASLVHDSHVLNSFIVPTRRLRAWPSPSAW